MASGARSRMPGSLRGWRPSSQPLDGLPARAPLSAVAQHLRCLAARLLAAASQPGHAAELLQHLLHLHELLQQTIHFFDRGPAAFRDALAATAVDDVLLPPLVR